MNIDIKTIAELREKTGAGLADCKKALEEADGDLDQAIAVLRKKGEIKAAKKSDRQTKEGVVALARKDNRVAAVVVNCETDFVALNKDFISQVQLLAEHLLAEGPEGFAAWAEGVIKNELVVKIGENIQLGDWQLFDGEVIGTYVHANRKVAGVVALSGASEELANELAMQVAAMSPKYLAPENVPAQELDKEKEIYQEQLKNEGKPENIWEKIIAGKLAKYYEDVCLLNQIYIKDDKKKIADLIKEAGADITIKEFKKFQV